MAQLLIRPPDELKETLQRRAQEMGIPLNALVLNIIREWQKGNPISDKEKHCKKWGRLG